MFLMSSWGIIYPPVVDPDIWTEEAEKLVGLIIDDSRLTYNFVDDDFVYIVPADGEDAYTIADNILLPKECIVEVLQCRCSTQYIMASGCGCGAFKSEKAFKLLLEKSKRALKRV